MWQPPATRTNIKVLNSRYKKSPQSPLFCCVSVCKVLYVRMKNGLKRQNNGSKLIFFFLFLFCLGCPLFPMTLWVHCNHQETCPPQLQLGRYKDRQVPCWGWRGLEAFQGGVSLQLMIPRTQLGPL